MNLEQESGECGTAKPPGNPSACEENRDRTSSEELTAQDASTVPERPRTPTDAANRPSLVSTPPNDRGLVLSSQRTIDTDERYFNLTSPPALPTNLRLSGVARPGITEVIANGERVFLFTPPCDRCVLMHLACATGPASSSFPCRYCSRDGADCKWIGGPVVVTYPTGEESTTPTSSTKKRPRVSDPGQPPTAYLKWPYPPKYVGLPSKVPKLSPGNSNSGLPQTNSQRVPSAHQLTVPQSQQHQSGLPAHSEMSTSLRKALNASPLSRHRPQLPQSLPWVPPFIMISIPEILTFLPEHILRPVVARRLFSSGATTMEVASFIQWVRGGSSVRASKEQVEAVRAKMNFAMFPQRKMDWEKMEGIEITKRRTLLGDPRSAADVTTTFWCPRTHVRAAAGDSTAVTLLENPTAEESRSSPLLISLAKDVKRTRHPTARNEKMWLTVVIESAMQEGNSELELIELCELKQLKDVYSKHMNGTIPMFDLSGEHPDIAWAREWRKRMAQLELEENVHESVEVDDTESLD